MGHSSRAIEISKFGLPRSKPASPRLSAQVDAKGMIIILEISSCFYTHSSMIRLVSGAETNMSLWFSLISTNESFLQEQTLGLVHHDIMTDTMVHDTWHHDIYQDS